MNNQARFGRNGDTELVHMSRDEVKSLGLLSGGNLTRNPTTGLPEAFSLKWLLPALAIGLTGGMAAPLLAGGTAAGGATAAGLGTGLTGAAGLGAGGVLGGGTTAASLGTFGGAAPGVLSAAAPASFAAMPAGISGVAPTGGLMGAWNSAQKAFGPAKDVLGAANTANTLFGQEPEQPIQTSPFMQNQGPNPGPPGLMQLAQENNDQSMQWRQEGEAERLKRARQIAMMRGMYGTA